MNRNEFSRRIYTGEFKLTNYSLDELHFGDNIIELEGSQSYIWFEENGKKSEVIFKFSHNPSEDDNRLMSLIDYHFPTKTRLSEDWECDNSPIEYYRRFDSAQTKKNLENLESGLKRFYEFGYITQNPAQLKRTLIKDKEFLHEVIGRRIGSKEHDERYRYAKRKRVFNFKTGCDNLIFARGKKIEIEKRNGTKNPVLERAITDFADENGHKVERVNTDVFGRKYFDFESDEMPCLITLNKKVEAGDVASLLKKMTHYWEEPWNIVPQESVDRVVRVKPMPFHREQKTVFDSYHSREAANLAKMMRTLPKKNLRDILGGCRGSTIEERRGGKRSVEVEFEDGEHTYRQVVYIERGRSGAEFAVNTADERVARGALLALAEFLLDEIKDYEKTRRKRYWE